MLRSGALLVAICCLLLGNRLCGADETCRSNATHIAWPCPCDVRLDDTSRVQLNADLTSWGRARLSTSSSANGRSREMQKVSGCQCACEVQTLPDAQRDSYYYLREHVMEFDVPFLETLGFNDDGSDKPDGLGGGMVGLTIQYALQAKVMYPYTDELPKHVWQEYVLNYASANEARSNWRPLLHDSLSHLVPANGTDMPGAVLSLNRHMWTVLSPKATDKIVFVGSQTPLIFDPMSVLVYGFASCTGLAILLVSALRSVGVPSRLVGTPAWHQDRSSGNHNWLEVFHNGGWIFMEPTALKDPEWVDGLDEDPCRRWFCNKANFPDDPVTATRVYAARLERRTPSSYYPLAWELEQEGVPGEEVTTYYHRICSKCS